LRIADVRVRHLLAALLLAAAPIRAAAQGVAIRGRIVAADTNAPLRNARVALESSASVGPMLTDSEGRFSVSNVVPGPHTLHASKTGYAPAETPLADGLEVRLARGGIITGRVLDAFGEPVPLMSVVAELVVRASGRTEFRRYAAVDTDDAGAYRLFDLPEAEFIVGLGGPRVMIGNTLGTPAPSAPRPPLRFFPRAASSLLAQRIPVHAGEAVDGINFTSDAGPVFAGVFSHAGQTHTARGATIRGHVVRPDGLPIRSARVLLSSAERLFSPYATITDGDGTYEFGDLRAGEYRIAATDTSFRTVEFGQRGTDSHGDAVAVVAGGSVDDVDISISRGSAISGRIVDEYGEPIGNANVRVERIGWSRGRARLLSVTGIASRQTDDLGRFRIFGLLPGRYVVSAVVGEPVPASETADLPGYLRTYFPGTTVASGAQLIDVNGISDALNTEFALVHGRGARIRGRVVLASGAPFDGSLWLIQSARSGAMPSAPVRVRADADGAFEFARLAPGEYVIQSATSRSDVSSEGEFGVAFVQVGGDDVLDAVVQMSRGSSVAGHVTFQGASPPAAPESLSITAEPAAVDLRSLADNPSAASGVQDDLSWRLDGLTGPRQLHVSGAPPGWMLARILVNGVDVSDAPLPFGAQDQSLADVEVVLTDRDTEIVGTVRDARDRPLSGATVAAFSTDRSRWYSGTRYAQSERSVSGGFVVKSLPPGEYFLAALDGDPSEPIEDRLDDPAFLESLVGVASRVGVAGGERVAVALHAVRPSSR
jgi:hypothetical protein